MPFSNSYNRSVANKVIGNAREDIEMKNKMYDDPASFVEPRSTQEYMSLFSSRKSKAVAEISRPHRLIWERSRRK